MTTSDQEEALLIDEALMRRALERLGQIASGMGIQIDLQVVGGAVMVMEFRSRQSTRDVDIVVSSVERDALLAMARQVAQELDLPAKWLSDGAAQFLVRPSTGPTLLEAIGIRVHRPSTEQLLAMKLWAMRDDVDRADAVLLAKELGLDKGSTELAIAPYLPTDRYEMACEELTDLWEDVDVGHD